MAPSYQDLGGFCGSNSVSATSDPNVYLFTTRINTDDDQKIYLRVFNLDSAQYGAPRQAVSKKAGDFTLNLGASNGVTTPDGSVLLAVAGGQGGSNLLPGHLIVPGVAAPGQAAGGGVYNFTTSSIDSIARQHADAAGSTAGKALQLASQAMEQVHNLQKQAPKQPAPTTTNNVSGVSRADVQQMVDVSGFTKAVDAIYDQAVNQKGSPLNNVIQQHVDAATEPLLQRIAALETAVTKLTAVKKA